MGPAPMIIIDLISSRLFTSFITAYQGSPFPLFDISSVTTEFNLEYLIFYKLIAFFTIILEILLFFTFDLKVASFYP